MDCEEMFDELQRRVSMFAKAIVENKMWKIGAVNVFWFIIQPVSSSRKEEDTVTAPLDRPVWVLRPRSKRQTDFGGEDIGSTAVRRIIR
jgi:hypothetical protein